MIRIGITGQAGFIGTHLYNTLGLYPDKYQRVAFKDEYFESDLALDAFVQQCDVIVHLAAMNRHADINVLYQTNVGLVRKLIDAMERTESKPYVIMSSSLQEERDNLYGKSKRDGRELFNKWADRHNAAFTGLIIPNVFGPFGVPYYNSVISTFSHQLMIGEEPRIEVDAELRLIFVGNLVKEIVRFTTENTYCTEGKGYTDLTDETDRHGFIPCYNSTTENTESSEIVNKTRMPERLILVGHQAQYKVTELLEKLRGFYKCYVIGGIFPDLSCYFDVCLFNTFRSYMPPQHFPVKFTKHSDARGDFVEVMKYMSGGQTSYSTTKPGITRGNHFHLRKVERFAVIQGKASIKLRKYGTDKVIEYIIDASEPAYVDMPVWFTHNITNIGDEELVTLFWINELFDPADPDTYFEEV